MTVHAPSVTPAAPDNIWYVNGSYAGTETGSEDTPDIRERGRIFRESAKSFDFWVDNGLALVGSPETVARKIAEGSKEIGFDHFAGKFHIGRMPHDMVEKSINLFGKEVIPAFD